MTSPYDVVRLDLSAVTDWSTLAQAMVLHTARVLDRRDSRLVLVGASEAAAAEPVARRLRTDRQRGLSQTPRRSPRPAVVPAWGHGLAHGRARGTPGGAAAAGDVSGRWRARRCRGARRGRHRQDPPGDRVRRRAQSRRGVCAARPLHGGRQQGRTTRPVAGCGPQPASSAGCRTVRTGRRRPSRRRTPPASRALRITAGGRDRGPQRRAGAGGDRRAAAAKPLPTSPWCWSWRTCTGPTSRVAMCSTTWSAACGTRGSRWCSRSAPTTRRTTT